MRRRCRGVVDVPTNDPEREKSGTRRMAGGLWSPSPPRRSWFFFLLLLLLHDVVMHDDA